MTQYTPLSLKAVDGEDLAIIAGLVQDSMFPQSDIEYDKQKQTFIIVVNRFVWECTDTAPYIRTHSILRISNVVNVSSQGVDLRSDKMCSILSTIPARKDDKESYIYITLAGGGAIRLTVRGIDIVLKDVGKAWQTTIKPAHENNSIQD